MCHDLLDLEGNKYVQEVPGKSGSETQRKEFLLEDQDAVWLEMCHLHIAEASEQLIEQQDAKFCVEKQSCTITTKIEKLKLAIKEFFKEKDEEKERLNGIIVGLFVGFECLLY